MWPKTAEVYSVWETRAMGSLLHEREERRGYAPYGATHNTLALVVHAASMFHAPSWARR
jgi:hypothetical protein